MKLLFFIPSFIKDAAKAVNRITLQEFIEVADETLTKLLGFATMVVKMYALRHEGGREVLHLWCAHREDIALCLHCGSLSAETHQEKPRCIRHTEVWGKPTFLHFLSRRFKCNECDRTFVEELPFVDSNRRQSVPFEAHVYQACVSNTIKSVAKLEGLSPSTVKAIFNYYSALNHTSIVSRTIRVLGIDELSIKKRHKQFVLVLSDIDRKCILAVLPDREKKTLSNWIEALSHQEKKSIQSVSIDMWAPYYQASRDKLPHAKVVVDRFHVMKQLNSRLTQLRTRYQKECPVDIQRLLKGSRWILVRNRSELSPEQAEQLNMILQTCPDIRTVYLLKEEFRNIFEKIKCREKAARFLNVWIHKIELTGNKYLAKFATTLKNWKEEILNYFIERITNGFVEGLNNKLRTAVRMAFGYRNFINFRYRAIAQFDDFHANRC